MVQSLFKFNRSTSKCWVRKSKGLPDTRNKIIWLGLRKADLHNEFLACAKQALRKMRKTEYYSNCGPCGTTVRAWASRCQRHSLAGLGHDLRRTHGIPMYSQRPSHQPLRSSCIGSYVLKRFCSGL
eukprot:s1267_g9.t1